MEPGAITSITAPNRGFGPLYTTGFAVAQTYSFPTHMLQP